MKNILPLLLASGLCSLVAPTYTACAQTSAFSYQGRLSVSGNPANGRYDLIFQVFDAAGAGNSIGGSLATNNVPITNGLFTVTLDFGSAPFTGPARWLQIQVSTNGAGAYSTLNPRQPLTPAPYASYAYVAGNVTNGAITSAQLAGGAVNTSQLAANAVDSSKIASGQVVKSLNGLTDGVSITQGANVTINTIGNSLQIAAPAGGLALPYSGTASSSSSIFTLSNSASGPAAAFMGKVGIGTKTPAGALHVANGGVAVTGASSPYTGAGQGVFLESGFGGGVLYAYDYGASLSGPLLLNPSGGNVGIGTPTPGTPLHVSSSATASTVLAAMLEPNLTGGGFNQIYLGRTPSDKGCATFTYTHNAATPEASQLSLGLYNSSYSLNLLGNGNVGIGTTSPTNKLEVNGRTEIKGPLSVNVNSSGSDESLFSVIYSGSTVFGVSAHPNISGPEVYFGSSVSFGPNSGILFFGYPTFYTFCDFFGSIYAYDHAYKTVGGTSWETQSDRRLKQDVRAYEVGLDEIRRLRPVRFRYRDDPKRHLSSAEENVGFIAQEVREVIPDAVAEDKDGYLSLKADPIHWAAINAIQELNQKLSEQKARLQKKDSEIQELRQAVAELQESVRHITQKPRE